MDLSVINYVSDIGNDFFRINSCKVSYVIINYVISNH